MVVSMETRKLRQEFSEIDQISMFLWVNFLGSKSANSHQV